MRYAREKLYAVKIVCMHNRVSFTRSVARNEYRNPNSLMKGRKADQE
jgi:hypothetical protein